MTNYAEMDTVLFGKLEKPKMFPSYVNTLVRNAKTHPCETAECIGAYDIITRASKLTDDKILLFKTAVKLMAKGGGLAQLSNADPFRKLKFKVMSNDTPVDAFLSSTVFRVAIWAGVENYDLYRGIFCHLSLMNHMPPGTTPDYSDHMAEAVLGAVSEGYIGALRHIEIPIRKGPHIHSKAWAKLVALRISIDPSRYDADKISLINAHYTLDHANLKRKLRDKKRYDKLDRYLVLLLALVKLGHKEEAFGIHDFGLAFKDAKFCTIQAKKTMQTLESEWDAAIKHSDAVSFALLDASNHLAPQTGLFSKLALHPLTVCRQALYDIRKGYNNFYHKNKDMLHRCRPLIRLPVDIYVNRLHAFLAADLSQAVIFIILKYTDPVLLEIIPSHLMYKIDNVMRKAYKRVMHPEWPSPHRKRKLVAPEPTIKDAVFKTNNTPLVEDVPVVSTN